jgi:2-polyprenyl-3-methyl-5-hydroxy-6-metoxy-1,4-benzoquinol methylase
MTDEKSTSVTRKMWAEVRALDTGATITLGPNTVDRYLTDPKRIAFFLSRYKFVGKMLRDCKSIVDVGCGDGFGTLSFLADTKATKVLGVDFDEALIAHAQSIQRELARLHPDRASRIAFQWRDMLADGPPGTFSGLACLDVIEHIEPTREDDFIHALRNSLDSDGIALIGTPNLDARQYASPHSEIGHINNYDAERLRTSLGRAFRHVFMFSMNDEMVHTGFDRLAHYLIALCVN